MFKETKSIAKARIADDIILVGIGDGELREFEELDNQRTIWRVPKESLMTYGLPKCKIRSLLRYTQWLGKITQYAKKNNATLINCHSIYELPIGVVIKFLTKSKLIYDTHELETERNGLNGSLKVIAKIVERILIKFIDHIFVVSESIADWYRLKYNLENVTAVRNFPDIKKEDFLTQKSDILRDEFRVHSNEIIYLYQGGLFHGRAIELILSVFSEVNKNKHIVFMGYGILEDFVRVKSKQYPNIHFLNAVHPNRVLEYTRGADVGLSIIENICLSYYYSLPNKLFEYVVCGVPTIVSNFPEMGSFIDEFQCGWKTDVTLDSLYKLINQIDKTELDEKRRNALSASKAIRWQFEAQQMIKVYEGLVQQ